MSVQELAKTIQDIAVHGKGILAADESTATIGKRFASIGLKSTEESRRDYRDLLFTAPGVERYINGVILYEETLGQKTLKGIPFPEFLAAQGIVPGIKVDKGIIALPGSPNEHITQGLDGLGERLRTYKAMGARFAKWRAVLPITDKNPSWAAIHANVEALAAYAAICQAEGIVPIVEPEVLMDGAHSLVRCSEVTECVLRALFTALDQHKVQLEYIILKPNMVVAGVDHKPQPSVAEVAAETLKVLRRTVPAAVPTVNFLSGGQSDELATAHLAAMNHQQNPWVLSYSYGRALQAAALKTWGGKEANRAAAQQALLKRARLNSLASTGEFKVAMEAEPA